MTFFRKMGKAWMMLLAGVTLAALPDPSAGQQIKLESYRVPTNLKGISIYHINFGPFIPDNQDIYIAGIQPGRRNGSMVHIAWSDSALFRTSEFGKRAGALVALNGGFFDVDKGGSVSYLEVDNKIIATTRKHGEKWAKSDSLLNAAFVIGARGKLRLEKARNQSWYIHSKREKAVMVAGPLLIRKGEKIKLENTDFSIKRHPRSCLCLTRENRLLLIAVDGRSKTASGMNLHELQDFLGRIPCRNAINLDGGGSTALWIRDNDSGRILNNPSDKEGERRVANCIVVSRNN